MLIAALESARIKLRGKVEAKTPTLPRAYSAEILLYQPGQFEDAIQRAAVVEGR